MKKTISPILRIGLIIFVIYMIIDRFITPLSDWIAIPLLVVGIVLILVDILKAKEKK